MADYIYITSACNNHWQSQLIFKIRQKKWKCSKWIKKYQNECFILYITILWWLNSLVALKLINFIFSILFITCMHKILICHHSRKMWDTTDSLSKYTLIVNQSGWTSAELLHWIKVVIVLMNSTSVKQIKGR